MANICLYCLESRFISFEEFNKPLKCDKRYPEQAIQRFISLNRKALEFIGSKVNYYEQNGVRGLLFSTNQFVGIVPLRSPSNGKKYCNLEVKTRYNEDIADIALMLEETLQVEYGDLELIGYNEMKAPAYLECINYFTTFYQSLITVWNKFDTSRKIEEVPSASTCWNQYVAKLYDPNNRLCFNNSKNIQTKNHTEWILLTGMLKTALNIFLSPQTPIPIRVNSRELSSKLSAYVRTHAHSYPTSHFTIHSFDPQPIKKLKKQANILLDHNSKNRYCWRINSAELFERYCQYVIHLVARKIGGSMSANTRYYIGGQRPSWGLAYLEPDIILTKGEQLWSIDAKYKSHMFNTNKLSEKLKEEFRKDLHQVLAYSVFDSGKNKTAILLYPWQSKAKKVSSSNEEPKSIIKYIHMPISSSRYCTSCSVWLVGIPFNSKDVAKIVENLCKNVIKNIELL